MIAWYLKLTANFTSLTLATVYLTVFWTSMDSDPPSFIKIIHFWGEGDQIHRKKCQNRTCCPQKPPLRHKNHPNRCKNGWMGKSHDKKDDKRRFFPTAFSRGERWNSFNLQTWLTACVQSPRCLLGSAQSPDLTAQTCSICSWQLSQTQGVSQTGSKSGIFTTVTFYIFKLAQYFSILGKAF